MCFETVSSGFGRASLKSLLRRVIGKVFNDTEIKGWCKEFEQKNAARQSVTSAEVEMAK